MKIIEYVSARLSASTIDITEHPIISYKLDLDIDSSSWGHYESAKWFDSVFPIDAASYLIEHHEVDEEQFNSFSVVLIDPRLGYTTDNVVLINPIWNPTPAFKLTCTCGFTATHPAHHKKYFRKDKSHVLGFRKECKKCTALKQAIRSDGIIKKSKIVGPYSLLSDVVVCKGCNTSYPIASLYINFRRVRWSTSGYYKDLVAKGTLEPTIPSMFSKYCKHCEKLQEGLK